MSISSWVNKSGVFVLNAAVGLMRDWHGIENGATNNRNSSESRQHKCLVWSVQIERIVKKKPRIKEIQTAQTIFSRKTKNDNQLLTIWFSFLSSTISCSRFGTQILANRANFLDNNTCSAIDMWMFAVVLYKVFNDTSNFQIKIVKCVLNTHTQHKFEQKHKACPHSLNVHQQLFCTIP